MSHETAHTRYRLILASASPRRAELLRQAGYAFDIVPATLQELDEPRPGIAPASFAEAQSYFKARSVMRAGTAGIIIGADTVVSLADEVFGKPIDADDARRMLQRLAGTTHQVTTGVTVIDTSGDRRHIAHNVTTVTMRPMSLEALDAYIGGGAWRGKAGGYGVQDHGDLFMERIDGSFSNVVGLPMEMLGRMLASAGCPPRHQPERA